MTRPLHINTALYVLSLHVKEIAMGTVYTEITLKNAVDVGDCSRGIIKEQDIRHTTVKAIADTGAITLVIYDELRRQLGLEVLGERQVTLLTPNSRLTSAERLHLRINQHPPMRCSVFRQLCGWRFF